MLERLGECDIFQKIHCGFDSEVYGAAGAMIPLPETSIGV
jgi:hypothetical protein